MVSVKLQGFLSPPYHVFDNLSVPCFRGPCLVQVSKKSFELLVPQVCCLLWEWMQCSSGGFCTSVIIIKTTFNNMRNHKVDLLCCLRSNGIIWPFNRQKRTLLILPHMVKTFENSIYLVFYGLLYCRNRVVIKYDSKLTYVP